MPDGNFIWLTKKLRSFWCRSSASVTLAIASAALYSLDPLLIRRLIDTALERSKTSLALILITSIALCLFMRVSLLLWSMRIDAGIEQDLGNQLRVALLEHMTILPARYHDKTPLGDRLNRLERDVDQIAEFAATMTGPGTYAVLSLLFNFAAMIRLSPIMALAIVPVSAIFLIIRARYSPQLEEGSQRAQEETARVSSMLCEHLSALPHIQLLGAQGLLLEKAKSLWKGMLASRVRQRNTALRYSAAVSSVLALAVWVVLVMGSFRVLRGALTIGGLVAFYAYVSRVFEPMSAIMETHSRMERVTANVSRVRTIMEGEPVARDDGWIKTRQAGSCAISCSNVSFRYDTDQWAVRNISLEIRPGSQVGIIGESGSGKSTLARLLVRLYEPQEGQISLGCHKLSEYKLSCLRKTICYVPQSPILFEGSIEENLLYGRPSAKPRELDRVLRITHLDPLLVRLPDGLKTAIGPSGYALSGGERQRLALARALLADAPILVLDESTSALDVMTEEQVLRGIVREYAPSILIIISHRLTSLSWVQKFVLLDQGVVNSVGDHETLSRSSALYRRLQRFDRKRLLN